MTNPLQAAVRRPFGYRMMLRSRVPTELLERLIRWITRGKFGVLDFAGLPSVRVTAPGRKTGLPRTVTLQSIDDGDELLVVGSNWGLAKHPPWAANLAATDTVMVQDRTGRYEAAVRELTGAERERGWARILEAWPNYELARQQADRDFRVFALRLRV